MRTLTPTLRMLCFVVVLLLVNSRVGVVGGEPKVIRCKENERRALMEFKAEVSIDYYGILSSWNKSKEEDCCKWRGIRCSNRTDHVTVLHINVNGDDYFPSFSGKFSPSLIELKHLRYLNISHNDLVGEIPHQLGNLTGLRTLDLGNNPLLTVENLEWLSHLRLLTHLDLTSVNLNNTSDWLQQVYKLPFLKKLILRSCNLAYSPPLLPFNNTSSTLTSLALVDLSDNNFISPSSYNWLFNITSLVHTDLSGNFLRASIPEAIGSIVSLEYLDMSNCQLQGELPSSFSNLTRLHTLYLQFNNFNGTLSEFLYPLSSNENNSLGVVRLDANQLGGSLPDFLTRISSLREISISKNNLSGSFPKNFGQVSRLVRLDLSNNQIAGPFPNITLFSSLEELFLYNNNLEDTIPEAYLSNLSNLKYLDLSCNLLSLKFSFDWVPPFQLDLIGLQNCTLGPHFPNWLQSQRNFFALDISGARIFDKIPLSFWDLSPRLESLNISYNNIQGVLPKLSTMRLRHLDVRSNLLEGPLPSFFVHVMYLDLSQNMFTGPISFLCTTLFKFIFYLDLSNNQLSGELPDCLMKVDQLELLNLANNNLSGKIPISIGLLNQLKLLQLRNNSFTGELPSLLMNNINLKLLDLSENQLSGEVPTWIGTQLPSLIILNLHNNEFFGRVPPQICHLRNAQVVDLSRNNLSGSIPNCIENLTSLVVIENSSEIIDFLSYTIYHREQTKYVANAVVQWKGVASEYNKTLGLLKLIDLSSNRLVGQIPQEFASLQGLISLNLSSNNLTGNIIPKIGQMKNLEILDLSKNKLSGEIPSTLASLTFLSVLDLSDNNLKGRIPSSTQLQSFGASKYAGNEQLCGLPLPNKCEDVLPLPPVGHDKDENNEEEEDDDDKLAKIGLFVSVVLGFGTGLWGFLGPIMLRRTWRHAYYRLLGKITDWIYVITTLNMARLRRKIYWLIGGTY